MGCTAGLAGWLTDWLSWPAWLGLAGLAGLAGWLGWLAQLAQLAGLAGWLGGTSWRRRGNWPVQGSCYLSKPSRRSLDREKRQVQPQHETPINSFSELYGLSWEVFRLSCEVNEHVTGSWGGLRLKLGLAVQTKRKILVYCRWRSCIMLGYVSFALLSPHVPCSTPRCNHDPG